MYELFSGSPLQWRQLGLPENAMITWTKRLIITASFLALLTTNLLAFTSTAFNAAVSGVMATTLAIRTVSSGF
jgi:hypothetical protein